LQRLHDAVPHVFPFRLVERSEERNGRRVAVVLGTVDGALATPGPWSASLVAEALAQAVLLNVPRATGRTPWLAGLDGVELLQPIGAGDRLEVETQLEGSFGGLHRFACRALSGGALAAVAHVTVADDAAEGSRWR
jgi:hypothetical protein